MSDRVAVGIILALAAIFFVQAYFGSLSKSLTWDEPLYIASGSTFITRNDFRLTPETPPLMQELAALPTLRLRPTLPGENDETWQSGNGVQFARKYIQLNADRIPQITFWARRPFIFLGMSLILAIGFWGRRLYGTGPALLATTAAALSPNLLAHAKLATTDLGCAFFMFVAVWTFWWASRSPALWRWVLCGLVTGLALLTKYTSLFLGPIYLILAIVLWQKGEKGRGERGGLGAGSLVRGLAAVGVVSAIVVGAGYNFSFDYSLYVHGIKQVGSTGRPGYLYYLFGNISNEPWWYYNLAALAVKLPVAMLVLIGLAAYRFVRYPIRREAGFFLLVPAVVVLVASFFDKSNIGVRHVLPALPFLFLFAGQAMTRQPSRAWSWMVFLLVSWLAIEAAFIYPHHLSYFNLAVGGPNRGPHLLDDSNIDWGQDLPALAVWQREHPEARPLQLLYFGNAPPAAYGVEAEIMEQQDIMKPRPGTYAISAHQLVFFRKLGVQTGLDLDWLTRYRPIARAGWSIYIYQFP